MKSSVETLNPTRVKLTVEVPFAELSPSLDAAYKTIARQVNVPGFRKGKAPKAVIDQRFGRALRAGGGGQQRHPELLQPGRRRRLTSRTLGQPVVDVTEFGDGQDLTFTAEVDVRPQFELPDIRGHRRRRRRRRGNGQRHRRGDRPAARPGSAP